ncbi:MAG: hypothetical protein KDM91_02010 [Verrucomicrobiae bacterium]|nr:hypothetical protein [Verrucomicrobiae bacterium]MCP5539643.1 hypothetical protein [Akkermansiaceae bacterium]MCP5549381.1 hypothetical protein [Akkermansiaceae bacterium]
MLPFLDPDREKPRQRRRFRLPPFRYVMGWVWWGLRWLAWAFRRHVVDNIPGGERGKSAVLWAIILHIVILMVALFIVALPGETDAPEIVAEVVSADRSFDPEMARLSVEKQLKEAQASASSSVAKLVRAETAAVLAAPDTPLDRSAPLGLGMGELGMGFGMGSGAGGGGLGMNRIPATMRGRCIPGERARLLHENGGTPEVETTVLKTLDWLKDRQNVDRGSWGNAYPGAMTGFALLCYLGHCETTKSPKYGETVTKGIQYLIESAKRNKGRMGRTDNQHWAYEHAIATYALGEAYALTSEEGTKIPGLADTHEQAIAVIVKGQNKDGGWVYGYTGQGNADLSVTGWQVQALKTASYTRVNLDGLKAAMGRAQTLIAGRQGPKGGFGYRNKDDKHSLTGVGLLGLQLLSGGQRGQMEKGFDFYFSEGPFDYSSGSGNLYSWYYMTQAAFNHGGETWEKWNGIFRDQLMENQSRDGSFESEGAGNTGQARDDEDLYRACLCTLMLEVYYRYLPATG